MSEPAEFPQISDAEWEVMKVVWDHGPLTAGEVVRRLADVPPGHPAYGWRPRTVKTLLSRLVTKGAVTAGATGGGGDDAGSAGTSATPPRGGDASGDGGRRFLYAARVARDQVVRQESRSFLARVFNGSVAPALLHFLADARLTPDEIEQLRRTLDRGPAKPTSRKKGEGRSV